MLIDHFVWSACPAALCVLADNTNTGCLQTLLCLEANSVHQSGQTFSLPFTRPLGPVVAAEIGDWESVF